MRSQLVISLALWPALTCAAPPLQPPPTSPSVAAVASSTTGVGSIPQFNDYQGSGFPGLLIPSTLTFGSASAAPYDSQTFQVQRIAQYVGGTNNYTNSALSVYERVAPGAKSFEWSERTFLDNFSTAQDGSQNNALYMRSIKESTGMTWSATAELDDMLPNPATSSVTEEFDLMAKGDDGAPNRVILDVWGKSIDGAPDRISRGIRVNSDPQTAFGDVIQFNLAHGCINFINDVATSRFKVDCAGNLHGNAIVAAAYVNTQPTTVAGLATADPSPSSGDRAFVIDAASCVFAGPISAGGSMRCPVYFDGGWKAG